MARGLLAIANRDPGLPPEPAWAERASRAHANAIENLAVFAPLVLIAAVIGVSNSSDCVGIQGLRRRASGSLRHIRRRNSSRPHSRILRGSVRHARYRRGASLTADLGR